MKALDAYRMTMDKRKAAITPILNDLLKDIRGRALNGSFSLEKIYTISRVPIPGLGGIMLDSLLSGALKDLGYAVKVSSFEGGESFTLLIEWAAPG